MRLLFILSFSFLLFSCGDTAVDTDDVKKNTSDNARATSDVLINNNTTEADVSTESIGAVTGSVTTTIQEEEAIELDVDVESALIKPRTLPASSLIPAPTASEKKPRVRSIRKSKPTAEQAERAPAELTQREDPTRNIVERPRLHETPERMKKSLSASSQQSSDEASDRSE